jgi:hypothetical protein
MGTLMRSYIAFIYPRRGRVRSSDGLWCFDSAEVALSLAV